MFEIELFICIKMDLALYNLQWLICHKIKPNIFSLQLWVISNGRLGSVANGLERKLNSNQLYSGKKILFLKRLPHPVWMNANLYLDGLNSIQELSILTMLLHYTSYFQSRLWGWGLKVLGALSSKKVQIKVEVYI